MKAVAAAAVLVVGMAGMTGAKAATAPPTQLNPRVNVAVTQPSETDQVISAINRSDLLGVVSQVSVSDVRFSGRWASALATPRGGQTDPAQVLLERTDSGWKAIDLGTDGVGCSHVGAAVRSQLDLWGAC